MIKNCTNQDQIFSHQNYASIPNVLPLGNVNMMEITISPNVQTSKLSDQVTRNTCTKYDYEALISCFESNLDWKKVALIRGI
jgi:hypothetical protein